MSGQATTNIFDVPLDKVDMEQFAAANGIVFLDLRNDFAFKFVFSVEENLLILLQTILPEKHIVSLTLLPQENEGYLPDDKKVIYDIFCRSEDGSHFSVEMQMTDKKDFNDRMFFYSTVPARNHILRGAKTYRLPEIYVIGILNFLIQGPKTNPRAINHYSIRNDRDPDGQLTDSIHYVTVELPKLPKELSSNPTRGEGLLHLLNNLGNMSSIPKSLTGKGLDNIIKVATFASMDRLTQEQYLRRRIAEMDYNSEMETAMDKGYAKGREEERAKAMNEKLESARRYLKSGVPVEVVVAASGLSEEQVKNLTFQNNF